MSSLGDAKAGGDESSEGQKITIVWIKRQTDVRQTDRQIDRQIIDGQMTDDG